MKRLLFVFNPNSGKGQIKNNLMRIIQLFTENDYQVCVYPTKAVRDGYRYILQSAADYDLVVCSGGDGTLNETVNAMMEYTGEKLPIGYIPSGSTNDFATSLNIPKDMLRAAQHIVEGEPLTCDVGWLNRKTYFNYVAAFGAFTEVSYATPQSMKNILGHQAYIIEGVKSISTMKPYYVKVKADNAYAEGNYVYGMVCNTESVAGIKGISGSYVNLQDGLFEVILIKELRTPLDVQQLITAFLTQNFQECDLIFSAKAKHIEFICEEHISWTVDGEFGGGYKVTTFDVIHNAVTFLVKGRKHTKL